MNSSNELDKKPSVGASQEEHGKAPEDTKASSRNQSMSPSKEHNDGLDDEQNHLSMVASTGWKWVMDDMWRAQQMASTPGEALILSCKTFLRFVKQNPKLYECLITFPMDEASTDGEVGPNAALEYLTQLASNAYQNIGQPSDNAAGFSRMLWATLLGLANDIMRSKAAGTPHPSPNDLVEMHIRPKCRLIL